MKSEDAPITDDEFLLRRVRVEKFRAEDAPIISPNAFEPRTKGRHPDTDCISLFRAECLDDPSEVLANVAPERFDEYGIARISVSFLKSLGLSAEIRPDSTIRGHVVIRELNSADYASDKARFTPIKVKLAVEASKDENILKRPRSRGE